MGARGQETGATEAPARPWTGWLQLASVGTGLFGLLLILAPETGFKLFAWIAFGQLPPHPALPPDAHPYILFVHGVLGAVMFGWAVLMGLLARGPLAGRVQGAGAAQRWALRALALSVGTWFVIDTGWSLLRGFPGNAALNLGFALLLGVPMLGLWRRLKRAQRM